MGKRNLLVLLLVSVLSLTSCSERNSSAPPPTFDDSNYEEYTPEPTLTAKDIFTVTRKDFYWNRNGSCSGIYDSLYLSFNLKNTSDRGLDAVELNAEISSEFGDSLKSISMDTSKTIKAGGSTLVGTSGSKCYKLNNFDGGDNTILNWTSGDQGNLTLSVSRVKFQDGTVEDFYGEIIYEQSFTVQ